jgi:hypothetical protein
MFAHLGAGGMSDSPAVALDIRDNEQALRPVPKHPVEADRAGAGCDQIQEYEAIENS